MTQKLVIIGAGMASGRMLEHLTEVNPDAYDITLFNAEPRGNYNRIMLSPVLSGEQSYDKIVTHDDDWYAARGIACRFGEHVTRIDRKRKVVQGQHGEVAYDKLLIATGSAPFVLPVQGRDLPGVVTYRDLDDTNAMVAAARRGGKAVVIGGGLLGLEAAAGLRERGMEVTVLHLMDHLMERQLDAAAGYLLRRDLEARGITVRTGATTAAILGWPPMPASRWPAASRWTPGCGPRTRRSTPSANAWSSTATFSGSSRPSTIRPRSPPRVCLASRTPLPSATLPPSSRSPAAISSAPAIFLRARGARTSSCATRPAASTSAW